MIERLHLSPRHCEEIEALLHKHLPDVEVWAYGSRVNVRSHDGSDLDLVLRGPKLAEIDTSRIADFIEALQDSTIPFLVEARDWARLPESFHHEVEREHVVMVEREDRDVGRGWRKATLGELGEVNRGRSRHRPRNAQYLYGGPYPFVQTGDIKASGGRVTTHSQTYSEAGLAQSRLWPANTMVITIAANIAETAVLTYPACFPDSVIGFIADESKCDVRFVEYMFRFLKSKLQHENVGTGSVQDNINLQTFDQLRFLLPPLSEQRAIAHILGTLDDKIELNRRMNETLEAMARALFKSWFVDFDPVRAKMAGRDTGLPQDLADLFPDRMVESELGKIPEGWEVKALDEIAVFQNGLALQKHRPQTNEERLPVVKIAQLRSGKTDSGEWATSNIRPECIIRDGDVVFSWSGSLMVTVWCSGRAALNQHLFKVTSTRFPKWFFLNNVRSHLADFQTIAAGKATTMGHIKRHHLSDAVCIVPDSRLLAAADGPLSTIFERSLSANIQSRTLAALRDALLPRLVSGELRVRDAASSPGGVE